jgi:hypothetical protein
METYVEQLRRSEAIRASLPRREYLSNDEYRRLKTALTRAKRLGGIAVLRAVEHAVERFDATTWPDDWNLWRIALEDAGQRAILDARGSDEWERLEALGRELQAAALVLFP